MIQECEDPARANHKDYLEWSKNYFWIGDSKNKGLGLFAKNGVDLKALDWSNQYKDHSVKYFLPCRVNDYFDLVGIWAHRNNSPNFGYIGQVWKYLQVNRDKIGNTILTGDFNSNVIWDQWDRWWNHSNVIHELGEIGIESWYHRFFKEEQGKETQPTLYFRKSDQRVYHIDYLLGPNNLLSKLTHLEIGTLENWIAFSDHMPLLCDFSVPISNNQDLDTQ